jgi:hypothetical protein
MPTPQHHIQNAFDSLSGTAAEKIGYVVASSMISAPLWRDKLHDWAGVASDVAPFLGCAWLVVQMVSKVLEARRKAAHAEKEDT